MSAAQNSNNSNNSNNSKRNGIFFTSNASRAKKLEEPAWTWLYREEDFPELMDFVIDNINDIPKYRKDTRENIIKSCFINGVMNYDLIFNRYTKLREFYSEKAADKIIKYVNAHYQHGSTNIIRPTLNLIISIFEPNIIEDFERDFSMKKCKEILEIYLFSTKYRRTAFLICKEPSLNLETNSRIKYKPGWIQSGMNALSSKKFLFQHFFPIFSGKQDPFSADVMKRAFKQDIPIFSSTDYGPLSARGRELFRRLGGIYKKEIEGYEKNLSKDWSHCLPNEVQNGSNCIAIPYLRLDITETEKHTMLADLFEIIKRITSLSDDDEKSETPVEIINSYPLHTYIGGQSGIEPATYDELVEYARVQNISVDDDSTADNISFVILFTMCKDIILQGIEDIINLFIKQLPVEYMGYVNHVRNGLDKLSAALSTMGIKPLKLSVSTYISSIKAIKQSLPDFLKEEFETILSVLVQLSRAYKSYRTETHNLAENYSKQDKKIISANAILLGQKIGEKVLEKGKEVLEKVGKKYSKKNKKDTEST